LPDFKSSSSIEQNKNTRSATSENFSGRTYRYELQAPLAQHTGLLADYFRVRYYFLILSAMMENGNVK
jgi:hypothetical protein